MNSWLKKELPGEQPCDERQNDCKHDGGDSGQNELPATSIPPEFSQNRRRLSLNVRGSLPQFKHGVAKLLEGRKIPAANRVPMFLMNTEQFQAEQDRVVIADVMALPPSFERFVERLFEVWFHWF